jgi:hypothetical protein
MTDTRDPTVKLLVALYECFLPKFINETQRYIVTGLAKQTQEIEKNVADESVLLRQDLERLTELLTHAKNHMKTVLNVRKINNSIDECEKNLTLHMDSYEDIEHRIAEQRSVELTNHRKKYQEQCREARILLKTPPPEPVMPLDDTPQIARLKDALLKSRENVLNARNTLDTETLVKEKYTDPEYVAVCRADVVKAETDVKDVTDRMNNAKRKLADMKYVVSYAHNFLLACKRMLFMINSFTDYHLYWYEIEDGGGVTLDKLFTSFQERSDNNEDELKKLAFVRDHLPQYTREYKNICVFEKFLYCVFGTCHRAHYRLLLGEKRTIYKNGKKMYWVPYEEYEKYADNNKDLYKMWKYVDFEENSDMLDFSIGTDSLYGEYERCD